MKVKELIEKLNEFPSDMEVNIMASYDDGFGYAGGKIQYVVREDSDNIIYLCNEEG